MNTFTDKEVICINPKSIKSKIESRIYQTWYDTWNDALRNDLKIEIPLYSDSFTRQDEIVSIYDHSIDECIGMAFFRYVSFKDPTVAKDSYFKEWPEIAQKRLISQGDSIAVCSQFTIAKKYRQERKPFKWKDALMYVISNHFIYNTNCDVMTGAVRVNKSVNQSSYSTGATPIIQNIKNESYKAYEDLVAFYRSKVISSLNTMNWPEIKEFTSKRQNSNIAI